jgi:hypothetical protein
MGLSLLMAEEIQNIAGLRDMREIDLGLDFIAIAASRAMWTIGAGRLTGLVKMSPHLIGFEILERTRMGLLLGDTHLGKHIENSFAFNFQLPGQIIDSNLAHPPFAPPKFSR